MIELFDRVYNCAHRGASGRAPENTLSALTLAIGLGADMAEIDVQQTADGQLVLFHDHSLERTSTGHGRLAARTAAELRELDAGSWFSPHYTGERIPTLLEAMASVRGRLDLNIELKAAVTGPDFLDRLVATIADQDFADHCVVTSFNQDLIAELIVREPDFAVGHIIGRGVLPAGEFGFGVDLLSLDKSLVSANVLEFAAAAGKAVHTWTVNESEEMSRLITLGVGGVITNYPDRFPGIGSRPTG